MALGEDAISRGFLTDREHLRFGRESAVKRLDERYRDRAGGAIFLDETEHRGSTRRESVHGSGQVIQRKILQSPGWFAHPSRLIRSDPSSFTDSPAELNRPH